MKPRQFYKDKLLFSTFQQLEKYTLVNLDSDDNPSEIIVDAFLRNDKDIEHVVPLRSEHNQRWHPTSKAIMYLLNLNQYHAIATILDPNTKYPTDIPISYRDILIRENAMK